jgi:BolA family transcriptional regulator, general stress-responsive regulator
LPAGETHYHVAMTAGCLAGQSRLARSRAVHEALAAEFSSGLHALSLSLRTPEEAG